MTWAELFERARAHETTVGEVRRALAERRATDQTSDDQSAEDR